GGTYDLAGGKLSAGEKGTVPSDGNTVLLLPGKAGNNRVVIRFQENTYGWLLPAVTLEAGKRYGYALSLGKEGGLILSGVSVRPWQEGEDYNGTIKPNK
ncbi:fimbrillin family protein, partial [Phocaeicola vulgatus]